MGELYSVESAPLKTRGSFDLPIPRKNDLRVTLTFLHLLQALPLLITYCYMLVISSHRMLILFH